jgi:hypothetical protein
MLLQQAFGGHVQKIELWTVCFASVDDPLWTSSLTTTNAKSFS